MKENWLEKRIQMDGGDEMTWACRSLHRSTEVQPPQKVPMQVDHDEAYFASYARMSVHEQFLKVVLDVGCCTGILSILCALTGAKRMYAVEAAHDIAHAQSAVSLWCLQDVVIEEKVDNMLASVITARDRWLNPGGLMLPSKATAFVSSLLRRRPLLHQIPTSFFFD
ncbi:hypothetical protein JHK86_041918 [Glycine max]|nr:hypothetical protein JHK86_041918 [Glycine max]